jgi:exopolysaccharide biosynthesis polyprenyl glycosylphosphotransferase
MRAELDPVEALSEAETRPMGPRKGGPTEWRLVGLAMLLDGVALFVSMPSAHWVRFQTGLFQGPAELLRGEHFATLVLLLPIWILLFGVNGLYRPRVMGSFLDQGAGITKAATAACLLLLALGWATQTNYFLERRLVLGFAWLFSMIVASSLRFSILRPYYRSLIEGGRRRQRIVIVGAGVEGTRFLQRIRDNDSLNYEVVGFVDDDVSKHGNEIHGVPVKGSVDRIAEVSQETHADQVFVAIPSLGQEGTLAMMSRCMQAQLPVRLVNDILHLIVSDTHVETIDGVPTYDIRNEGAPQLGLFIKRAFDLTIAGVVLTIFAPLFLFIALLIKIFSPGPVLFKQVRAGQHGREFTMCKFRTMRLETDDSIHREYATNFIQGRKLDFADEKREKEQVFKMTTDPRITPVGHVLRRTSLDELPQILNVLRGEMSIVGPRPPIFYELNHYKEWHKKRLRAKPGLTGLWQVSGRSSVPFDEMVLLDLYYIDHWSLKTDLEILFRTIPVVLFGEGAY